jgi:SRSO17 transposase
MTGASIETVLEHWASSLRDAKTRIRPLFTQARVAASARLFLDSLLGPERRKTGWMRAEAAGGSWPLAPADHSRPWTRGCGCAARHRARVRGRAFRGRGCGAGHRRNRLPQAGHASCGLGQQYTGPAGKITNCQIGVFAALVSQHRHAFIDRALYLPKR